MPQHKYIYIPNGELWPRESINGRFPKIRVSAGIEIGPAKWLDMHRPVEQMTWAPGEPLVIHDRLISEGGWIARREVRCFNLYLPPTYRTAMRPGLSHGSTTSA